MKAKLSWQHCKDKWFYELNTTLAVLYMKRERASSQKKNQTVDLYNVYLFFIDNTGQKPGAIQLGDI